MRIFARIVVLSLVFFWPGSVWPGEWVPDEDQVFRLHYGGADAYPIVDNHRAWVRALVQTLTDYGVDVHDVTYFRRSNAQLTLNDAPLPNSVFVHEGDNNEYLILSDHGIFLVDVSDRRVISLGGAVTLYTPPSRSFAVAIHPGAVEITGVPVMHRSLFRNVWPFAANPDFSDDEVSWY